MVTAFDFLVPRLGGRKPRGFARRYREIAAAAFAFALCVLGALPAAAGQPSAFTRTFLSGSTTLGDERVYRVQVAGAGSHVFAVLPKGVRSAELVLNGTVVQSLTAPGAPGLARPSVLSFAIPDATPRDRIEIRVSGASGPPTIVREVVAVSKAFELGLGSGLYYGILGTVFVFQIVAIFLLRDYTVVWYAVWIASFIALTFLLDGFASLDPQHSGMMVLALHICAGASLIGFGSSYLRLFEQSRRLFWYLIGFNIVAIVAPVAVAIDTHGDFNRLVTLGSALASVLSIMMAALLRQRDKFKPATYLIVGLATIAFVFCATIVGEMAGAFSPFILRWGIQIASVLDALVFALGIAYRTRFALRERRSVEKALLEASHAANHDMLTGFLNRRGLEARLGELKQRAGTVFFIDIDGFKAVNDLGGHEKGDETLVDVARIIRLTVRDSDIVARVGGDEFAVLVLAGLEDKTIDGIVDRLASAVAHMRPLGDMSDVRIGLSIGVAPLVEGQMFEDALREADADTYRIKRAKYALTPAAGDRRGHYPLAALEF